MRSNDAFLNGKLVAVPTTAAPTLCRRSDVLEMSNAIVSGHNL
jgi:hypothetical protein